MSKPIRIQRKRTKGWKMPANTVYVGRPTDWGNPFAVPGIGNKTAVERFALHIQGYFGFAGSKALNDWLAPLKGKNLACFCKLSEPCHADVLLDLANEYPSTRRMPDSIAHKLGKKGYRKSDKYEELPDT